MQALFIAPKMYAVQTADGKLTFKVKGVNTSLIEQPTMEELITTFVNKTPFSFNKQVCFKSVKVEGKMLGISVIENLIKVYNVFTATKRQ